jgi:hypothetical protein
MAGDDAIEAGIGGACNERGLRQRSWSGASLGLFTDPAGTLPGEPTGEQLVSGRAVGNRTEQGEVCGFAGGQNEVALAEAGEQFAKFRVGEDGKRG